MTIWGNHSATQYPDLSTPRWAARPRASGRGGLARERSSRPCAKRGAAIIEARGSSSAASAANAALDHVCDWVNGTEWTSSSVVSDGSHGVPEGLISSFPCRASAGAWEIIQGVAINDFSRARIDASVKELTEERDAVRELGLI